MEVTKDVLRAALVAYQGLCGNDPKPARAIMATHGGADVLAKVPVERYVNRTHLGTRTLSHHSSFGCPFFCNFCAVVNMVNGRWL